MKAFWQLLATCFLIVGMAQTGRAQVIQDPVNPMMSSGQAAPFSTAFTPGSWLPGRMWLEFNLVDQGLGYEGSFATVGGKTRLFSDPLDGRWMGEFNFNFGIESGGMFTNAGIERAFSIDAAGSDFVLGAWFDLDADDQNRSFTNTMQQVGVSGGLKSRYFDLLGNGYFPVGTTDYALGDPNAPSSFLNRNIVMQAGIDSALEGFDATLSIRPEVFAIYGGSFQLGGYQYSSQLVDSFAGVRLGTSFRAINTMIFSGEYTYDDRFKSTGVIQLGWDFGAPVSSPGAGITGRDLEKTRRQAHISRYNQDLILAINPVTGLPYNVLHVDNLAAAGGDGSFENPFDELSDAEAASGADDIIFINHGDGTNRLLDTGIVLKDRQQLLGAGVQHIIDTQFGGLILPNAVDGRRARITNDGGAAVTLASGNTVRGLIMDGDGVNMIHGILGVGAGGNLNGGIIENNIIRRATLNGVTLNAIEGDWTLADNIINRSGQDGVNITNALDSNSEFIIARNNFSTNLRDGFNMSNYDGSRFFFIDNVTNGNIGNGINMTDFLNGAGTGANWVFVRSTAASNGEAGIRLDNADGNYDFLDSRIVNNTGSGIQLIDVRNVDVTDRVFIGLLDGTANTISGNGIGAGAGIESILNSGTQNLVVTDTLLNNNGVGVLARANNVFTVLNTTISDNFAISNNTSDGVRIISTLGATSNVVISQSTGVLNMANNGLGGGNGISLFSEDGAGTTSTINANISDVVFTNTGAALTDSTVFGLVEGDALLNLNLTNITSNGSAGDGFFFDLASTNDSISNINIVNAIITGAGDDGMDFDMTQNQRVDIAIANSSLVGSGGDGIEYTSLLDARSVLTATGNQIIGSGEDGIEIDTFGTSEMLLYLSANSSQANAASGLNVNAGGTDSRISARIENNNLSLNGTFGAFMRTSNNVGNTTGGLLDVLMVDNTISNNDTTATVGLDMNVINSDLGRICLAMSSNSFVLPVRLENNASQIDFILELDGTTNGVGVPGIIVGDVQPAPFGSTCEPAIEAQELIFEGLGF